MSEKEKTILKLMQMSEEERNALCDSSFFNDYIRGYLVIAMKNNGFSREEILKTVHSLNYIFDECSAAEAKKAWFDF